MLKTNDDFLGYGSFQLDGTPYSPDMKKIEHPDMPPGFALFLFKEQVYIPMQEHIMEYAGGSRSLSYGALFRGAGTNPYTREVPIHYVANPGGLRRAIACLKQWEQDSKARA